MRSKSLNSFDQGLPGKENLDASQTTTDRDLAWKLSQESEVPRPTRKSRKSKASVNYLEDFCSSPEPLSPKKRTTRKTRKANNVDSSEDELHQSTNQTKRQPPGSAPSKDKGKGKFMNNNFDYNQEELESLDVMGDELYWSDLPYANDPNSMILNINQDNPLTLIREADIRDSGQILGMSLSPDGTLLATYSNFGAAQIWELDTFKQVQSLRDESEENIDEFYTGRFHADGDKIIIGGKLKDRKRWSDQDDDNHIMPCPLKVFDLLSGKVIATFDGHDEEVLCIKYAIYKGNHYLVSTSQDGYIVQWKVDPDWKQVLEKTRMQDGVTCMAFNVSFLPHTGNRYFIASCDDSIRLFDMESRQLVQTFGGMYSFYCDCAKVVHCLDMPQPPESWEAMKKDNNSAMFAYIVSRGVEILDAEDNTVNSRPNSVILHKLIYPQRPCDEFQFETVKQYAHESYHSNSWLIKITSNGRYIAAPTFNGDVFFFNIQTGMVAGILRDHEELEVRDVLFHPYRPLFFSCADDGTVKVYTCSSLVEKDS